MAKEPANDMDEIVSEFLIESHEGLDRLDRDLLSLERDPHSTEALASIFRTVHTIKGTCGFLAFGKLERVAHVAENLLGRLRNGELTLNPHMASALLSTGDAFRQMLGAIESTGSEGDVDYTELVDTLSWLQEPRNAGAAEPQATKKSKGRTSTRRTAKDPKKAKGTGPPPETSSTVPPDASTPRLGEILVASGAISPEEVEAALREQEKSEERTSVTDTTIRVDVGLLDNLMTLVGELVLARNQIVQRTTAQQDTVLAATSQRLNLITTELQEGVMKTRMQPIATVWGKFPRIVRDLALACGKQVRIQMEGEDTELDRSIIEAIKDPLTHLVRNVVDHGIEMPEVRRKAGKPAEGLLLVRAFHEGGQVNIEITDDGAGIDPERIRAKAIERGLIGREQAAHMGEREILSLIFTAGFSMADKITNVSGRGVGTDVVRTNIERVGGSVDVQSRVGEGTTFKIKIPLTLAIIPALVVTTGGDRYAIPQVNLLELVRVEGSDVERAIELIHGTPVYRLRGRLLPLVYLAHELRREERTDEEGTRNAVNIVVLQADDRQFGLVVEGVNDSAEIVVKPLGHHLKGIGTFAGATIMGDGKVGLILDVMGLAQKAHVVDETRDRTLIDVTAGDQKDEDDKTTLLLFSERGGGRMAIPLELVDRLEEFPRSSIERSGPQSVVQYRDEILPLVEVSDLLLERRRKPRSEEPHIASAEGTLQVVVHRHGGRTVGIVVERILDIVEQRMDLRPASRSGVSGTMVIHDRVTEVIDLPSLLAAREEKGRRLTGAGVRA